MDIFPRILNHISFSNEFGRQMRFVAGPRQVGKTTLAKAFLSNNNSLDNYYNWDQRKIKISYRQNPYFFSEHLLGQAHCWICFDEIHKMPKWKNILKDFFDTYEDRVTFIITGSARLDLFRKSGDSLAGRYFLFHLFPFNLRELLKREMPLKFLNDPNNFIENILSRTTYEQKAIEHLLRFSGFPEPMLKASDNFHIKWQNDYIDHILNEDLRPLSKIAEIENIANLFYLLPTKIGSPLSINSLKEDLEVSFPTIKNYVKALDLVYMIFAIKPYSKKINRSLKKEEKIYFYDWTRIEDKGIRFENYVAFELKNMISLWNDAGIGRFELCYVRNRAGKESDFLITYNFQPWILLVAKLSYSKIESHHIHFAKMLGNIPFIRIVLENNITQLYKANLYQISASRFFSSKDL